MKRPGQGPRAANLARLAIIADCGFNLTGAAELVGIAPSAMQRHLVALEADIGVRLVDRGPGAHKPSLTEEGARVVESGRRILSELERAWAKARRIGGAPEEAPEGVASTPTWCLLGPRAPSPASKVQGCWRARAPAVPALCTDCSIGGGAHPSRGPRSVSSKRRVKAIRRTLALWKARRAGFEGEAEGIQVQVADEIIVQQVMLDALEGEEGQEEAIQSRRARLDELHAVQSAMLRAFGGG